MSTQAVEAEIANSKKSVTITRKIQLFFDSNNEEDVKGFWQKLYGWNRIVFKAANFIATHHFLQENIKELFYITDDTKVKLSNISKDENGILTTSKMNTTYQLLSLKFKGEIPMAIITALNSSIVATYNKERKDYFLGKKSLRSYKSDLPIPVRSVDFRNIKKQEEYRNYCFDLYGIPFRTNFGKDFSGNQIVWENALIEKKYKFCDSSIQLKGNKIFLLAVFQFDKTLYDVDPEIKADCYLDIDNPMIIKIDNKEISIGTKEEYLHGRIAIQGALRRTQKALTFTKGGHGREKKLQAITRFEAAEKNYVSTKVHQYTAKLINYALKHRAGTIVLKDQFGKEKEAKKDVEYLLRNWGYFGIKEKIEYKANKVGITVVVE